MVRPGSSLWAPGNGSVISRVAWVDVARQARLLALVCITAGPPGCWGPSVQWDSPMPSFMDDGVSSWGDGRGDKRRH
jgi:hypothetical protein